MPTAKEIVIPGVTEVQKCDEEKSKKHTVYIEDAYIDNSYDSASMSSHESKSTRSLLNIAPKPEPQTTMISKQQDSDNTTYEKMVQKKLVI